MQLCFSKLGQSGLELKKYDKISLTSPSISKTGDETILKKIVLDWLSNQEYALKKSKNLIVNIYIKHATESNVSVAI